MISDGNLAQRISELFLNVNSTLEGSVIEVRKHCSPEESKVYGMAVGRLICDIFDEVLDPIYRKHPSLKPKELE